MGTFQSILLLLALIGILAWLFRPGSGDLYQSASRIPLEEDNNDGEDKPKSFT